MASSVEPAEKRLAWQFYVRYFVGGFTVSVLFEIGVIMSVYWGNPNAITVSTIFAVAWLAVLVIYLFIRSCCTWWLGDDDVLDELEAKSRARGESRFHARSERSGSVYEGADGRRNVTIQDLFLYEEAEQTNRTHAVISKAKERRIMIVFFIASALGIIGGFAGAYFFQQYWFYANGPTYEDVSPRADPATIADAHLIRFDSTLSQYTPNGGVIQTSLTRSYCAAPCISNGVSGGAVSFWAMAENCCSGDPAAVGGVKFDCPDWVGTSLGEVVDDNQFYFDASAKAVTWWNLNVRTGALHVRILSEDSHASAQRVRLYTAWLCLLAATLGWPLTIGLMVLLEKCLSACNLFDPDPSRRCACCQVLVCWKHTPTPEELAAQNDDPLGLTGRLPTLGTPSGVELRELAAKKQAEEEGAADGKV